MTDIRYSNEYLTNDLRNYRRRAVDSEYMYGNTAIQPERRERTERTERRIRRVDRNRNSRVNENIARNQKRAAELNSIIVFGYFFFAVFVLAVFFTNYISLRSDVYNAKRTENKLEIQLSEICAANDDTENRINGTIDLENIKKIAMNELGMTYADDSQIITYESTGSDFVRQYIELEE